MAGFAAGTHITVGHFDVGQVARLGFFIQHRHGGMEFVFGVFKLGGIGPDIGQGIAVFAFTIHPDVSGRPQVLLMLERLIEYINGHDGIEWATFEEIADDFRKRYPFASDKRPEVI